MMMLMMETKSFVELVKLLLGVGGHCGSETKETNHLRVEVVEVEEEVRKRETFVRVEFLCL